MGVDFNDMIFSLFFTIFMYEFFPVVQRYIFKKTYEEKKAKKIAIINSIVVYILITIYLVGFTDQNRVANLVPALLWGYVAYSILKENKEQDKSKEAYLFGENQKTKKSN